MVIVEDNQINQKVLQRMLERLGYTRQELVVACNGQIGLDAVVALIASAERDVGEGVGAHEPELRDDSVPRRSGRILVFMDLFMPVMGGLEATAAIRAHLAIPAARQPYIIALTANAMSGDRSSCITAGCDEYMTKPCTLDILTLAVSKGWNSAVTA